MQLFIKLFRYFTLRSCSLCRTFLYLCFSLTLAATCIRSALLTNFMIASTVSAISVLLLAGLYVSSFSSCLGAMYGTPRVLQSIASQKVIPGMSCLQIGVISLSNITLHFFLINSHNLYIYTYIHTLFLERTK